MKFDKVNQLINFSFAQKGRNVGTFSALCHATSDNSSRRFSEPFELVERVNIQFVDNILGGQDYPHQQCDFLVYRLGSISIVHDKFFSKGNLIRAVVVIIDVWPIRRHPKRSGCVALFRYSYCGCHAHAQLLRSTKRSMSMLHLQMATQIALRKQTQTTQTLSGIWAS